MRKALLAAFAVSALLTGNMPAVAKGNAEEGKSVTTPPECARLNPEGGVGPTIGPEASRYHACLNEVKRSRAEQGVSGSSTPTTGHLQNPESGSSFTQRPPVLKERR